MPSRPGRARSLAFLLVLFLFAFFAIAANATSCPSASTTTCFVNLDGTATSHGSGSSTTFSLTNSALTQIGNETGSGLGFLSFTTGDLTSGSLAMGGSFAAGGTFKITGTYGNVTDGTLFSGSFSGPVTWTLNSSTNCTVCTYTLSGTIAGTWYVHGAQTVQGATVQINFTSNGLYHGGRITDVGGVSYVDVPAIPEPASVALMGTGLVAASFAVRRRVKGNRHGATTV